MCDDHVGRRRVSVKAGRGVWKRESEEPNDLRIPISCSEKKHLQEMRCIRNAK